MIGIRRAFTLIELLVAIAIIAILAAMLFPTFGRCRCCAQKCSCLSNERQLQTAWLMYASDYDDTSTLCGMGQPAILRLSPYIKNTQVLFCPADQSGNTVSSYGYNHMSGGLNVETLGPDLCRIVVFVDAQSMNNMMPPMISSCASTLPTMQGGLLSAPHLGMCNATFADGHAETENLAWFQPSMFSTTCSP